MPLPTASAHDDPASPAFPTGTTLAPDLLSELPHDAAFALWQVLRCVELWTAEPEQARREVFDRAYMERWERSLLTGPLEPEARFPLAVVVSELAAATPGGGRLPWACVCVADWALGRGARRAGLAFAEAAARTAPQQPRYAWLAGRLLRGHGNARDGERWLRRAHRLAVVQRDWETQARSLTSLGNVCLETGRDPEARGYHTRALLISRRFRLREQEAMALHDLFAIAAEDGNQGEAERFARAALDAYHPTDPRVPRLAHDVAYFWMAQGFFGRALRLLQAVRPHFRYPDEELRVVANTARAAGGLGDRALFAELHAQAEALVPALQTREGLAASLLEVSFGAVLLGEWGLAQRLAGEATKAAQERSESDVILRAEGVAAAALQRNPLVLKGVMPERHVSVEGSDFADEIMASLERAGAGAA